MPRPTVVCSTPRCPRPAVRRGRCGVHAPSEEERGYGQEWRRVRNLVRASRCENCGSTRDLTVDHIVPQSLGGTNDPRNLRTLCRSCHSKIGRRSTSRVTS